MKEQSILAYYRSEEEARGALRKLQALRVIDASIDRFGAYPGSGHQEIMNPVIGEIDGLGELTLSGDFTNRSAAILAAAEPDASGMADRGDESIAGRDVLLTAVIREDVYEQAMTIIRETGGIV